MTMERAGSVASDTTHSKSVVDATEFFKSANFVGRTLDSLCAAGTCSAHSGGCHWNKTCKAKVLINLDLAS
jgi:hypothetical protein